MLALYYWLARWFTRPVPVPKPARPLTGGSVRVDLPRCRVTRYTAGVLGPRDGLLWLRADGAEPAIVDALMGAATAWDTDETEGV